MEKKKPPYAKAYIEITNLCNMHCSFCHGHSRPLKQAEKELYYGYRQHQTLSPL